MTFAPRLFAAFLAGSVSAVAPAADVSTHVLDLVRGAGRRDVPVVLLRRGDEGGWTEVARARTDGDGRVRAFQHAGGFAPGVYKLHFDLSTDAAGTHAPFFPEIDLVFRVTDATGHYHVPVVLSPFGYSTYRGT